MKKVLIYRHQLFLLSEVFIPQQTRYLTRHSPIFVCRELLSAKNNHLIKSVQNFGRLEVYKHKLLGNSSRLIAELALLNPTLIHAHFGVEGVYALPIAKKFSIPLITTFHGFDATYSKKHLILGKKISWLRYLLQRSQLAEHGQLFICVSNFIRDAVLKLGFPENKLITHYIGVDTEEIKPTKTTKNEKIILHVARLVEKKGTEILLRAFATINKKYPEAKLIIVGTGPLLMPLQQLCMSLNIADKVTFAGVLPHYQVIDLMHIASIFCLPSITAKTGDSEGLGMVLLEAAACQLPIVATQHGGIVEAVQNEKTGFLVTEKNVAELTDRIAYLLNNESICAQMGTAGRQFVQTHFNLKTQTQKLEVIYQQISM